MGSTHTCCKADNCCESTGEVKGKDCCRHGLLGFVENVPALARGSLASREDGPGIARLPEAAGLGDAPDESESPDASPTPSLRDCVKVQEATFECRVNKEGPAASHLGLLVAPRSDHLFVCDVWRPSLVSAWNEVALPERIIRWGMRVVFVNGVPGPGEQLLKILQNAREGHTVRLQVTGAGFDGADGSVACRTWEEETHKLSALMPGSPRPNGLLSLSANEGVAIEEQNPKLYLQRLSETFRATEALLEAVRL